MIVRENYLARLRVNRDNGLIKVVTGIRRCGKSTLMRMYKEYLIQEGVPSQNIIDINFELMSYDEINDYRLFYDFVKSRMSAKGKYYLLFDEIQHVEGWERAVNSLNAEGDADIYVTGSNAWLLSSDISTLLSGRYVEIKMLPLSFREFLLFGHLPETFGMEDKFNQYIKYGSFPTIPSLHQDNVTVNEFLSGVYNTVIVKDIAARNEIRDITLLERILKYIISNTGNMISANKIAGYINSQGKGDKVRPTTVSNYMNMLEQAYIIYQAPRYDIRGKEILRILSKYYVVDTGIRNMLTGYSGSNIGHVFETLVYFELLRRGYQVYIGKWKDSEIDFFAVRQDEKKYYQVAASILDAATRERELAPLKALHDNYEKTVLTMDKTYITDYDGIKFKNIIDFLLEQPEQGARR